MSKVIWSPLPKQIEFLSAPEEEVLYGGAAGSAKSESLMMDALGLSQGAVLNKNYTALIIRKTFEDMEDLINRTQDIYPLICPGASYNKSKHLWTFPSGARIKFGNCFTKDDVHSYQGQEYTWIGIEELAQFETDYEYQYLKSRLRTSDPSLKCYMRATCNPGKYKWIREYFKIDNVGTDSYQEKYIETSNGVKIRRRIRFIRAKLSDNPYLYESGEYEARLLTMPEEERNSLLFGRWDAWNAKGAIYSDVLANMRKAQRICKVPYDSNLTVYCVMDLGRGDTNPIIFAQTFGKEIRIFNYYENNGHHISHYFDLIQQKKYQNVKLILPHDAKAKTVGAEYSVEEQAITTFGRHNVEVLPREDIELGISTCKKMLDNTYVDESLTRLLEVIENYKRKYNKSLGIYEAPLHDEYSNGADALRYLAMHLANNKPKFQFEAPKPMPFFGFGHN
jgi:hypothetical protein